MNFHELTLADKLFWKHCHGTLANYSIRCLVFQLLPECFRCGYV